MSRDEEDLSGLDLDALRARIDAYDRALIEVISGRARVVAAIGAVKRATGAPIYAPHREREVLSKVRALNPGPLPDRTIEAVYRELMSGSFQLEQPLRVGFLGPEGSFSHVAAARHFGSSVELVHLRSIEHVCEEVAARRCDYGLVPYENSIGGSISDTLDALQRHDITVYAESLVRVVHNLLANCALSEIEAVHSKPQVFAQCRHWLAKQLPDAALIPASSTSAAAQVAAKGGHIAAIGSALAGTLYGVNTLFESIEDKGDNITRFLVLSREHAQPSGEDKTTLTFVTANKPGALVDVLAVFRRHGVNLTHIDKCPSQRTNWEYTFFVDCEAHASEPAFMRVVEEARELCLDFKVLGSYPRAVQVL